MEGAGWGQGPERRLLQVGSDRDMAAQERRGRTKGSGSGGSSYQAWPFPLWSCGLPGDILPAPSPPSLPTPSHQPCSLLAAQFVKNIM